MATKKGSKASAKDTSRVSTSIDELLLAALDRGDDTFETGRMLVTFKEGAHEAGVQAFASQKMRIADARDFSNQAAALEDAADADAFVLPEIGVAVVSGSAAAERGLTAASDLAADSAIESIDPEHFVFIDGASHAFFQAFGESAVPVNPGDYLRGFVRAAEIIAADLREANLPPGIEPREAAEALGVTWGLSACRVPDSTRTGQGIKVAILDTGLDIGHPDFAGRAIVSATFVGQPVQDLHSHGTHCTGTSCGTKTPAGSTPRYGIAYRAAIHIGKVLTNSGKSVDGSVLAGMNWAIANRCEVMSMSLSGRSSAVPAYTAAGQRALDNGLLMIAAAGNEASTTGAPANSPTIFSVASVDQNLTPSSFSNFGKIEIAGPGRDIFSSVPRPTKYGFKSGTSMATPHVAGCAALWAESSPSLRGMNLWRKLQASAKHLAFPATRVGSGLVQAP